MIIPAHVGKDSPLPDGESQRIPLLKWLFAPLRLLFKLHFGVVFFLSLLVLYLPFRILLYSENRYRRAFKLKRAWAFFLQWASLIPIRVKRAAPLPKAPYIVCSNHSSYMDIIQMYNVIPEYFLFMGKYELLRWPLFNIFFKGMNIAVNRRSHNEAAKAFKKASRALESGTSIAIFPEGTIPVDVPRMLKFKDGAFRMAIEHQVPIVPVTFVNHWRLFGDPEVLLSRGRPGVAKAIVHAAIPTEGKTMDDLVALRQQVFNIIQAPLLPDADRRNAH